MTNVCETLKKEIDEIMEAQDHNMNQCKQCGEPFEAMRKDALFCSSTCRWMNWKNKNEGEQKNPEEKQTKSSEENPLFASLQGIISNEPKYQEIEKKEINPEWLEVEKQEKMIREQLLKFKKAYDDILEREKNIINDNDDWMIPFGVYSGAALGGLIGLEIDRLNPKYVRKGKKKIIQKNENGKVIGVLLGLLSGKIIAESIRESKEQAREERKRIALIDIQKMKLEFIEKMNQFKLELEKINFNLVRTNRWIITKEKLMLPTSLDQLNRHSTHSSTTSPTSKQKFHKDTQQHKSEKIISSEELEKMNYKALCFTDKWADFFGYPSLNFHCTVHGMSGEGKSTFSIQFANYLAENFGKVIYVSGEEGFSKTFKDKFIHNNATSSNLFVADLRKLDDMLREIPNDQYNFIFIDSLDNMRIDAEGMKKLREYYKDSALITISQSTKQGKMRGSYEIVHDSDIAVKVENGIATTTKNRFKEKEMELRVF